MIHYRKKVKIVRVDDILNYNDGKYTIMLRDVVRLGYRLFDENYLCIYTNPVERAAFEDVIYKHFYARQIGFETIDRFLLEFNNALNLAYPLMKQKLESSEAYTDYIGKEGAFNNYSMTESESVGRAESESVGRAESATSSMTGASSGTSSDTVNRSSTTSNLAGAIPSTPYLNLDAYADSASRDTSTGTDTKNITNSTTDNQTLNNTASGTDQRNLSGTEQRNLTRVGNIGTMTAADVLIKWREVMLNINMEYVKMLESLFLQIF